MNVDDMVANSLANPSGMPVAQHDVVWARCRPPHERTQPPKAGDRVWYRHHPHGPLTEAEVERVDESDRGDYNVWRFVLDEQRRPVVVNGERLMEKVDDPWPDVWLRTDFGRTVTREARIDGAPGWLPKERP